MPDETDHLETEYVFIDTEAYVREKFNWQSRSFARIKELAESNQMRVLITSVTRGSAQQNRRGLRTLDPL